MGGQSIGDDDPKRVMMHVYEILTASVMKRPLISNVQQSRSNVHYSRHIYWISCSLPAAATQKQFSRFRLSNVNNIAANMLD